MNEREVREYLGVGETCPHLDVHPDILAGMADVEVPATDEENIEAFRVFLKCTPGFNRSLIRRDNITEHEGRP